LLRKKDFEIFLYFDRVITFYLTKIELNLRIVLEFEKFNYFKKSGIEVFLFRNALVCVKVLFL